MLRKSQNNIIEVYRGFASPHRLYCRGRVLRNKQIVIKKNESFFNSVRDNILRMASDERPRFPLHLEVNEQEFYLETDREGFFTLDEPRGPTLKSEQEWLSVTIRSNDKSTAVIESHGEVLLPSTHARLGIISDIDDTILKTDTLFKFRAFRNTLMYNPFQREQLKGMSSWINAFHEGHHQDFKNPIFYVSKSPRNIFSYLSKFLEINRFPKGPVLLSEWGRKGQPRSADNQGHKKDEIERIFTAYPQMQFILLGDIAGRDPQIYQHFAKKYPNQVEAIYIRDIAHQRRQKKYQKWFDEHQPRLELIEHTIQGAQHALDNQWITHKSFEKIQESLE